MKISEDENELVVEEHISYTVEANIEKDKQYAHVYGKDVSSFLGQEQTKNIDICIQNKNNEYVRYDYDEETNTWEEQDKENISQIDIVNSFSKTLKNKEYTLEEQSINNIDCYAIKCVLSLEDLKELLGTIEFSEEEIGTYSINSILYISKKDNNFVKVSILVNTSSEEDGLNTELTIDLNTDFIKYNTSTYEVKTFN